MSVTTSASAAAQALTPAIARSHRVPAPGRWVRGAGMGRLLIRALSLLAGALAWQWASKTRLDLGIIQFRNVPAPTEVIEATAALIASPKLIFHVRNSLARVFAGFAGAAVLGVALGLLIGRSRRAADLLMPLLEVMRPIPGVAWIPLAILMFPSSELSMMFITFMGALFPILLNTVHGVDALDGRLVASARTLGARSFGLFREVILPGALPSIVTGLSIGMGTAWFCLVTAEMISGQFGIGYYTWESYNLQRYPDIVVGMLFIGMFGMLSSVVVKKVGRWSMPWYRLQDKAR